MKRTVYVRYFNDGSGFEIGILSHSTGYSVMETDDFAYTYNGKGIFAMQGWTRSPQKAGWVFMGYL